MKQKWMRIGGVTAGAIFCLYLFCFHYTEAYHLALARNYLTGETKADTRAGIHITAPWVKVVRIDTRPVRVCVTSAGRGFNCKLVEFDPTKWEEFLAVEGFRYYWWANRVSLNMGYDDEYRGMKDLLRGHAFGAQRYSFIKIVQDFSSR
ncbi:MAG: hypothetical protein KBD66_04445 [Candidatus Doudnabacteria bacterium]|nr:hypothetical protein [Candidatus Doudnabacteria bacterium]